MGNRRQDRLVMGHMNGADQSTRPAPFAAVAKLAVVGKLHDN